MRNGARSSHLVILVVVALGVAGVAIALGSGWVTDTGEELPPDLTKSGTCTGPGAIFCDGFEGGSPAEWSASSLEPCSVPSVTLPTP